MLRYVNIQRERKVVAYNRWSLMIGGHKYRGKFELHSQEYFNIHLYLSFNVIFLSFKGGCDEIAADLPLRKAEFAYICNDT